MSSSFILCQIAAPAIVYGLNSFGRVRNGFYDKLKGAVEVIETKNLGEHQKTTGPPNLAAGSPKHGWMM